MSYNPCPRSSCCKWGGGWRTKRTSVVVVVEVSSSHAVVPRHGRVLLGQCSLAYRFFIQKGSRSPRTHLPGLQRGFGVFPHTSIQVLDLSTHAYVQVLDLSAHFCSGVVFYLSVRSLVPSVLLRTRLSSCSGRLGHFQWWIIGFVGSPLETRVSFLYGSRAARGGIPVP